jgi:hypothetical protein
MSAEFKLKQHLRLSPNAQIKNLVPENLDTVPAEKEWKLGRFWFNTSIGKLQGVFLKLDKTTGLPVKPEEMEVRVVGVDALGPTKDGGYWPDGLFDFTEQTKISDAMDDVNEALKDLAPPAATMLRGDLVLIEQKQYVGKISSLTDTAPDKINLNGVSAGDEISYIIGSSNVKATLPVDGTVTKGKLQRQFGKADKGKIVVYSDEVLVDAGVDLYGLFNEPSRDYFGVTQGYDPTIKQDTHDFDGNPLSINANPNKEKYKSSTGSLIITKIERYNDFKRWQCGSGIINCNISPGRHTFRVEHDITDVNAEIPTPPFKTNTMELFYDPNSVPPSSKINGFNSKSGIPKFLSGIPFLNTKISFVFDYVAKNVFTYTYWDKPISIKMDGSTHDLLEWNSTKSTMKGLKVPLWNHEFSLVGYTISYDSPSTFADNVTITAKAGKPITGWGPSDTLVHKILIDTYPSTGNSTPLKETFVDEEYRININVINQNDSTSVSSNTVGTWDSTTNLKTGNAQQYMGSLIRAKSNFIDYNINTDYSSLSTSPQYYYRRIYANNKPNSNGVLKITTENIIGIDFDVHIKFPGITGWLNINKLFDTLEFTEEFTVDGTGCAATISKTTTGYECPWTVGTLSTVQSDFGYLIEIVLKTNKCIITEIEEISENWR